MINQKDLDFFIANGYNVMFVGKHGVGKTAIIKEAFERNNLKWMYFSAATMDPWVDFIGVPKEVDGHLQLIKPRIFHDMKIEALFFDEFNRAPKKVRNAVMELIQFKTINGEPISGVKCVWIAINPDDEEGTYDVEKMDPAQKDRFEFQIEVPYKPCPKYFSSKYGILGKHAVAWWSELPAAQKELVTPRRLDYALDVHSNNGPIRMVLDESTNVTKLLGVLKAGPAIERLEKILNEDDSVIEEFFKNENNFSDCIGSVLKNRAMLVRFLPLMQHEKISMLMSKHKKARDVFIGNLDNAKFLEIAEQLVEANLHTNVSKLLSKHVGSSGKFDLSNSYRRKTAYKILSGKVLSGSIKKKDENHVIDTIVEIINRTQSDNLNKGTYKNVKMVLKQLETMLDPSDTDRATKLTAAIKKAN